MFQRFTLTRVASDGNCVFLSFAFLLGDGAGESTALEVSYAVNARVGKLLL
jgi:hypothetical protein